MSHAHAAPPTPPPPLRLPLAARAVAAVVAAAGAAAFLWTLQHGHGAAAWSAYLIGAFYALSLGVFGVLWVSILYLSKAVWSVSMRRIPEAMTAWLLPGGALTLLLAFGAHDLYHWTHLEALESDALLAHKQPFLNLELFVALVGLSVLSWVVFAALMVRNSRRQDQTGAQAQSRTNVTLAAVFVVVFALTYSLVSYYLLMSLEPHWFSTMYAVLTFTDLIQTGTAFVALIVALLLWRGRLAGFVNENHLHSLAKMMFAATGFWAYIYFCQYLLIWYANIPEETAYFLARMNDGWGVYLLLLPLIKFVVPFVLLVPRANKRHPGRVAFVAVWLLVAQFLELILLVSPALGHGEAGRQAHLPWLEALVTAGFVGLFVLVFAWSLGRQPAVPLKDPRLGECLALHQ